MCHIQADVKCGIRGYKQRMGGAIACPLVKSTKKLTGRMNNVCKNRSANPQLVAVKEFLSWLGISSVFIYFYSEGVPDQKELQVIAPLFSVQCDRFGLNKSLRGGRYTPAKGHVCACRYK